MSHANKLILAAALLSQSCSSPAHVTQPTSDPFSEPAASCLSVEEPDLGLIVLERGCATESDFEVPLGGGTLDGRWRTVDSGLLTLEARLEGVDVSALPSVIPEGWFGSLSAQISAAYDGDGRLSSGVVSWQLSDLVFESGSIDLGLVMLYLTTPTRLGHLEGTVSFDPGVIRIERLDATGGDIEIRTQDVGHVWLEVPEADTPRLEIDLDLTLAPDWVAANEMEGVVRVLRQCDGLECRVRMRGPLPAIPRHAPEQDVAAEPAETECIAAETHYEECSYLFCDAHPDSPLCLLGVDAAGTVSATPRWDPPFCEDEAEDWAAVTLATSCEDLTESWPRQ